MMDAMFERVERHLARAAAYQERLLEAHRIKSIELVRLKGIAARQQLRILELEARLENAGRLGLWEG